MRKLSWLAGALLLASSAVAGAQTVPAPAAPAAPQSLEQLFPAIDQQFRDFQRDAHIAGLVWGMVRGGRLIHVGASGVQDLDGRRPVDADTLFRIASMSKAFTALAILKLRDEGRLSLDALAETYVPEMRGWHYPTTDSPHIRVRDLLSHVGGFVTDDPWGDRQTPLAEAEFTRMLRAGVPFTRSPETAFEYSNLGYALLGRIVTNVSRRPFEDYIHDEIMRPLGMNSTGYDYRRVDQARRAIGYRWENEDHAREPDMARGAFGAMGGVITSANDYSRWVAFLLSAWPPRDGPETGPVRRATVRELAQGLNFVGLSQRPIPGQAEPCRMPSAYGKGFIVAQSCGLGLVMMHGGGYPGYGSYVMLFPERGLAMFAFANGTYAAPVPPMMAASDRIRDAGAALAPMLPVSDALAASYRVAGQVYAAGSIEPARSMLAMNFLMDRSPENWSRTLAGLRSQLGSCATAAPPTATGNLAGTFEWTCERGRLQGQVLLAPTNPPTIQALRFRPVPDAPAAPAAH
jgi:serine-type D-Ala-D-Ala carboxypeptidase/endopeptidase